MSNILVIQSSAHSDEALSSQIAFKLAKHLQAKQEGNTVLVNNLLKSITTAKAPFVEESWLPGNNIYSENALGEIKRADTIIIAAPVYNLSVPAVLKAWIDQIVAAGVTFTYVDGQPKGLLENKKVYVVATSGTPYDILTQYGMNFHENYLKAILKFIGIEDVTILPFTARNPEDKVSELKRAEEIMSAI
jgi:FMN-dependent NADH-azoreductase